MVAIPDNARSTGPAVEALQRFILWAVPRRVAAWIANAKQADTWRLRQAIFRGGLFDPLRRPDRPPLPKCCAAVPTCRGQVSHYDNFLCLVAIVHRAAVPMVDVKLP